MALGSVAKQCSGMTFLDSELLVLQFKTAGAKPQQS